MVFSEKGKIRKVGKGKKGRGEKGNILVLSVEL